MNNTLIFRSLYSVKLFIFVATLFSAYLVALPTADAYVACDIGPGSVACDYGQSDAASASGAGVGSPGCGSGLGARACDYGQSSASQDSTGSDSNSNPASYYAGTLDIQKILQGVKDRASQLQLLNTNTSGSATTGCTGPGCASPVTDPCSNSKVLDCGATDRCSKEFDCGVSLPTGTAYTPSTQNDNADVTAIRALLEVVLKRIEELLADR